MGSSKLIKSGPELVDAGFGAEAGWDLDVAAGLVAVVAGAGAFAGAGAAALGLEFTPKIQKSVKNKQQIRRCLLWGFNLLSFLHKAFLLIIHLNCFPSTKICEESQNNHHSHKFFVYVRVT